MVTWLLVYQLLDHSPSLDPSAHHCPPQPTLTMDMNYGICGPKQNILLLGFSLLGVNEGLDNGLTPMHCVLQ